MAIVHAVDMELPQLELNPLFPGIWIICHAFECAISDREYDVIR